MDISIDLDLGLPDPFDPATYFPEHVFVDDETMRNNIITETADTTKQGVFRKLWEIIKRAWRKTRELVQALITGTIDFFKHNPYLRSADQIYNTIIGPGEAMKASGKLFSVTFLGNQKGFEISPVLNTIKGLVSGPGIMGHDLKHYQAFAVLAAKCVQRPELLDGPIKIFREIKESGKLDGKPPNAFTDWAKSLMSTVGSTYTITLEDLKKFQLKLNEFILLQEYWEDFSKLIDASNLSQDMKHRWVESLNIIAAISVVMQTAINMIGASLRNVYVIDPGKEHSMDNIGQIAEFVKGAVTGGHPFKYTASNVKTLASKRLNVGLDGTGAVAMGGHTRFVMFPEDNSIVYKIAGNMHGWKANRTEHRIYKALERHREMQILLAATYDIWPEDEENAGFIISSERVIPLSGSDVPNMSWRKEFKKKLDEFLQRHDHKFVVADINVGGFGKRADGGLVLLDYGYGARRL